MKNNKIKFVIFLSIVLIITLLISSIALSILISKKQKEINKQEQEIEKLNNQLDYYKNNTNSKISLLNNICEVELWL